MVLATLMKSAYSQDCAVTTTLLKGPLHMQQGRPLIIVRWCLCFVSTAFVMKRSGSDTAQSSTEEGSRAAIVLVTSALLNDLVDGVEKQQA